MTEMLPTESVPIHHKCMIYFLDYIQAIEIQSTLVISKSKGPSKIVRDIRTSTYQICSIEEKTI